jgi:hypothetical protein
MHFRVWGYRSARSESAQRGLEAWTSHGSGGHYGACSTSCQQKKCSFFSWLTPQEERLFSQYDYAFAREVVGTYPYVSDRITTAIALLKKHEKRLQVLHYDTPGMDAQDTHDLLSLLEDLHDRMGRLQKRL